MDVLVLSPRHQSHLVLPALPPLPSINCEALISTIAQHLPELPALEAAATRLQALVATQATAIAQRAAKRLPDLTLPTLQAAASDLALKHAQTYTIRYAVQLAVHIALRAAPSGASLPLALRLAVYIVRLGVRQLASVVVRMALGRVLRGKVVVKMLKAAQPAIRPLGRRIARTVGSVRVLK